MPQAASPNWPALSPTGGRTLTQASQNLSQFRAATHGAQHRPSRSVPAVFCCLPQHETALLREKERCTGGSLTTSSPPGHQPSAACASLEGMPCGKGQPAYQHHTVAQDEQQPQLYRCSMATLML